jgi:hypothetical protein
VNSRFHLDHLWRKVLVTTRSVSLKLHTAPINLVRLHTFSKTIDELRPDRPDVSSGLPSPATLSHRSIRIAFKGLAANTAIGRINRRQSQLGSHRRFRFAYLRTQFCRILKKAKIKPWPKLFHAMRSSRETELVQDHPMHVVAAWQRHSPAIANKHYLMIRESDFERANGKTDRETADQKILEPENLAQKAAQSATEGGCQTMEQGSLEKRKAQVLPGLSNCDCSLHQLKAEDMGFEPTTHCWASDFESDRWPIRLSSEPRSASKNARPREIATS